jgi:hypothetical protein
MGLAAVNDPATEAAEVADGRDACTSPVVAEGLMHKGTGLDCLACLHFAQPLNHTGRQDRIGIEKELSFPRSPFCPYTGRPARRFLNSASLRLRSQKNIAIISLHPDRYGHIWTGYAVFFLLSSHFKDLYLPAFPTY